jgi:hypothetical protein
MSTSETREVRIVAHWESEHIIDVPIDWVDDGSLGFTEYEDIRPDVASLIDWAVLG